MTGFGPCLFFLTAPPAGGSSLTTRSPDESDPLDTTDGPADNPANCGVASRNASRQALFKTLRSTARAANRLEITRPSRQTVKPFGRQCKANRDPRTIVRTFNTAVYCAGRVRRWVRGNLNNGSITAIRPAGLAGCASVQDNLNGRLKNRPGNKRA